MRAQAQSWSIARRIFNPRCPSKSPFDVQSLDDFKRTVAPPWHPQSVILKSRAVTHEKGENYQVIRDSKGAPEYYLVPFADFHKLIERETLLFAHNLKH